MKNRSKITSENLDQLKDHYLMVQEKIAEVANNGWTTSAFVLKSSLGQYLQIQTGASDEVVSTRLTANPLKASLLSLSDAKQAQEVLTTGDTREAMTIELYSSELGISNKLLAITLEGLDHAA